LYEISAALHASRRGFEFPVCQGTHPWTDERSPTDRKSNSNDYEDDKNPQDKGQNSDESFHKAA